MASCRNFLNYIKINFYEYRLGAQLGRFLTLPVLNYLLSSDQNFGLSIELDDHKIGVSVLSEFEFLRPHPLHNFILCQLFPQM
jgi:hypothetical protein